MKHKEQLQQIQHPRVTRRGFLGGVAALASTTVTSVAPARAATGDVIAYIGAATSAPRNAGGIYSYSVNPSDGSLTPVGVG